jgi:hypothetical protein
MRRHLLASVGVTLGLLALGAPGDARAQGQQDFQLVNRTGYQINEVYVGASASSSWGRDVLGDGVLANQRSLNVRFGRNARACQWDIKVVYDDGDTSEFRGVDLCSVSKVTLFWNRQANQTRFVTE